MIGTIMDKSLPPKRGQRIRYTGGDKPVYGNVVSLYYGRLKVRFDGHNTTSILHPSWCVEYVDEEEGNTQQELTKDNQ